MLHTARCEIDLAYTYFLRNPKLAKECALAGLGAAIKAHQPALAYEANELIICLGGL